MSGDAYVFIRVIPQEYRGVGYSVVRNNVYRKVQGTNGPARQLVGQLKEVPSTRLPIDQAARLFGGGGKAALTALSAVGSVASVATLGVCVLGFLHVSRALKRIEARLEGIEQKLDMVADMIGVIDQKVDQLIWRSDAQLQALAEIRGLLLSFETADVHRALETLDIRSKLPSSKHQDHELMEAARVLHKYRTWLAQVRESAPMRPPSARTELLRAEVLLALAEARARLIADDANFAAAELERVLAGARQEVRRMRTTIVKAGAVPSLLSCMVSEVDMHRECIALWSWLDLKGTEHATKELLRESTRGYNDLAQRLSTIKMSEFVDANILTVPQVSDADGASIVAAYRLALSLEQALTLSAAMAVAGPQIRPLLHDGGVIDLPALSIELEKITV